MPATHSKLLSFSSGKLVTDYNAIEKKDEKLGSNSRYKKRNAKKKNRKRVRWFLPISRKINMPLVSQISYLAMYMLAKKGSKREDSLKKMRCFFSLPAGNRQRINSLLP